METIPVVVTYNTVRGGVVFHAPAWAPAEGNSAVAAAATAVTRDKETGGGGDDSYDAACNDHNVETEQGSEEESKLFLSDETQQRQNQRPQQRRCRVVSDGEMLPVHGAARKEPRSPMLTTREGQRQSEQEQRSQEAHVAVHERSVAVRLGLDNAFPGRPAVSTVSLRSSAQGGGFVQGMESSGPLVQTVLTRRDLPGVDAWSSEVGEALLPGEGLHGAPVEVRRSCVVSRWLCYRTTVPVTERSH